MANPTFPLAVVQNPHLLANALQQAFVFSNNVPVLQVATLGTFNGRVKMAGIPTGATITTATLEINPATATAGYWLLAAGVGGTAKFTVDNAGITAISGATTAPNFISNVAIGTQPYACTSTTVNTNLNADQVDGKHEAAFLLADGTRDLSGTWTIATSSITLTAGTLTAATLAGATLNITGNSTLGNEATDTITCNGRLIPRTTASDPKHATPASRPAGSVGEIAFYSGKWYGCTDAGTPTWEQFTSA